jgi:hypothetical protein
MATDAALIVEADVIGDETTVGANTADRVRDMLTNVIQSKINNDKIETDTDLNTSGATVMGRDAGKDYIDTKVTDLTTYVDDSVAASVAGLDAQFDAKVDDSEVETDTDLNTVGATVMGRDAGKSYMDTASASLLAQIGIANTSISTHASNTSNPHAVTKAQVGLGSAENTADLDKPVSTATQTALNTFTVDILTGTATLSATAFGKVIELQGTSADYTVNLPTAVGNNGKMLAFKGSKVSLLSKNVTIDAAGTELIDGDLTKILSAGGHITLMAREISGVGSWDVMAFDQGNYIFWTPTFTGFSGQPTGNFYYKVSGKTLHLRMEVDNTTFSGTTVTFTLPLGLSCAGYASIAQCTNAGAVASTTGKASAASTNVVSCFPSPSAGWTASSTRGFIGHMTFQII